MKLTDEETVLLAHYKELGTLSQEQALDYHRLLGKFNEKPFVKEPVVVKPVVREPFKPSLK